MATCDRSVYEWIAFYYGHCTGVPVWCHSLFLIIRVPQAGGNCSHVYILKGTSTTNRPYVPARRRGIYSPGILILGAVIFFKISSIDSRLFDARLITMSLLIRQCGITAHQAPE
eukprot:SAG31_NODE_3767_length_3902_cov_1.591375_7_plen_114_part_00